MTREEAIVEMKKHPSYGLGYIDGLYAVDEFIQSLDDEETGWALKAKVTNFLISAMLNFDKGNKNG